MNRKVKQALEIRQMMTILVIGNPELLLLLLLLLVLLLIELIA